MDISKIQTGHIVRYEREKHFGFIETEEKEKAFFFFDKEMQRKFLKDGGDPEHKFSSGDEIDFRVRVSSKDRNKWEAYDLKFIRNIRREQLLEEAAENPVLKGYIKKISNGKLMVKHVTSYVYIPLQITDWETDIEKNYTSRIDELVEFRLTQTENIYKLIAVLADATYTPEFHLLTQLHNNKEIIQAALVGKNEDGYFATLLDGKVDAFILIPKELTEAQRNLLSNLKKGDSLPVTIKQIYNNKKVSLVLAA